MQTPDRPSQGCTEPHASATRSAVQSRQPSGGLFQQTMQQRTIDKLRKKLTKERKRRSKIQGKLKLSQEQSLQLSIRCTGGDVLSIWAPSVVPEGTSVSSWGSFIDPGAGACRSRERAKTPEGLIRPGGSPPRPRRTGAAGRTAALATRWPFQRRDAAGR